MLTRTMCERSSTEPSLLTSGRLQLERARGAAEGFLEADFEARMMIAAAARARGRKRRAPAEQRGEEIAEVLGRESPVLAPPGLAPAAPERRRPARAPPAPAGRPENSKPLPQSGGGRNCCPDFHSLPS